MAEKMVHTRHGDIRVTKYMDGVVIIAFRDDKILIPADSWGCFKRAVIAVDKIDAK